MPKKEFNFHDYHKFAYINQEETYIISILEHWKVLKNQNEKERNQHLYHFRDENALEKLSKFHTNIYQLFIDKMKSTGFDILIGGSSVIASFPPYDFIPNDLDFYVKNITYQKIQEIDKAIREIFPECKIIVFRKLITMTWWIFNPQMTKFHITLQMNLFDIKSWSDVFIVYHSDIVSIGYEIKSGRFVYLKDRFQKKWLTQQPLFSWGSTILTMDNYESSNRVVHKYSKRGIDIKIIQKDKYLKLKYIIKNYFHDDLSRKSSIEHSSIDQEDDVNEFVENEQNNLNNLDDSQISRLNLLGLGDYLNELNYMDDEQDDDLSFINPLEEISNNQVEENDQNQWALEPDIYSPLFDDDSLSSNSPNQNLFSSISSTHSTDDEYLLNDDNPEMLFDKIHQKLKDLKIAYCNEEEIKKILKEIKIDIIEFPHQIIKCTFKNVLTWSFFYQFTRKKFHSNLYRLEENHLRLMSMTYSKNFLASTNVDDLLMNIDMPPLIDLILLKHQYNTIYMKSIDFLNCNNRYSLLNKSEIMSPDDPQLCPILYTRQTVFLYATCGHHISLTAYLLSCSSNKTIITCPMCRQEINKFTIQFYE